jgi:hypothetical protein
MLSVDPVPAMKCLATWVMATMTCSVSVDAWAGERPLVVIRSGDVAVAIPERYVGDTAPAWLRIVPGLRRDANAVAIVFPVDDLRASLPDVPINDDIRGTLTLHPSESDLRSAKDAALGEVADIWLGRGRFSGRVVEGIQGRGTARVFDRWEIESRSGWTVVAYPPGPDGGVPPQDDGYIVGRCQPMGPQGSRRVSCLSSIRVDNLTVSIYMSEANVLAYPRVHDEIRRRVAEWEVSHECSGSQSTVKCP